MRHDHPRGDPAIRENSTSEAWCRACVSEGITTFEERTRPEAPERGSIKTGMQVEWFERDPKDDQALWKRMAGQVWSHAPKWSRVDGPGPYYWIVDSDGKAWLVAKTQIVVTSPERAYADVHLV